jgi:predicted component of type VI protein secretion system
VAQAHGRIREVVTILAGFLQLQFGVLSLSLGHVACSHLLGIIMNTIYFQVSLLDREPGNFENN